MRDQPPEFWDQFNASPPPGAHLRIHPILHWTEADIWAYTKRENIPIIPLYLAQDGKRYRSLGDQDITNPVASNASSIDEILIELENTKVPERAGPRARPRNRRRFRAAARRRLPLDDIRLSVSMNMIFPTAISATPNGTTRPQVRIVIVGHVDHGKSTLVGRLLHETGSLPEGKLEMLKAVSARRGMPFEWSFLLDALQTERDQGITIDTTQIRFRTGSRDVVLIDAPGHAEFLRNMITGASQADGAVLIIDALEGVRDQTRRHGYLLHLLGVKQVAVVVNKMDRVDFSAARFKEISDEISAHLIGLGVTPRGGDSDFRARRRRRCRAHAADRLVQRPDRGGGARCARAGAAAGSTGAAAAGAGDLQIRRPPHRRGPHRIRQPRRRRRDRHHARRQDREDQVGRKLAGDAGSRQDRPPDDRSASRSTANCSSSAATSSPMSEARRAIPAGFARVFSGCTTSRW